MRKITAFFSRPERTFLVLALVFGVPFCFLLPPGAGFDETAHLTRAIEVSMRQFIPNRLLANDPQLPMSLNEVTYRSRSFLTPIDRAFFERYAARKIEWNLVIPKTTKSVYFPLLYVPQALVVRLAKALDWPVLTFYYACRLAEWLGYVLLCFIAIRVIPFGKWTLALLALSPIAIQQAASISTDPYTNGAAFLFIAWILALALQKTSITRTQTALTLLSVVLLFSAKINVAALIFLLVLIPRRKFQSAWLYYLFLAAVAVLFLAMVLGWNGLVAQGFQRDDPNQGFAKQIPYLLSYPLSVAGLFARDLFTNGLRYIQEWIAVPPNFVGVVPPIVYPLYACILILTVYTDRTPLEVPRRVRLALLACFALGFLFTLLVFYMGGRGPGEAVNLPGRYLTPIAAPLFLALILARPPHFRPFIRPGLAVAVGAASALTIYMASIYLTFYVLCGVNYYTPGLCALPVYKNLDPTTTFSGPVSAQKTVTQEFIAECPSIHSVMVWGVPARLPSDQSTTFALRDVATGQVAAQTTLANRVASGTDWLEVPLTPVEGAAGRTYAIEISSTNPDENTSLDFALSAVNEYTDGRLVINGQPIDHFLYFHYGCKVKNIFEPFYPRRN